MICQAALFISVALIAVHAPVEETKGNCPPPPWHLVDLWWDIGQDSPFESYSVDVDLSDDVPSTTSLYIAPVGLGHLGKTPFYGGIQTQMDSGERNPQVDGDLRHLPLLHGKMDHGHHLPAHGRAGRPGAALRPVDAQRAGRCNQSVGIVNRMKKSGRPGIC